MDKSWMPTVAGILNIISGVLALLGTLALIFVGAVVLAVPEIAEEPDAEVPLALAAGMIWALVVLCFVAALLSIIGGIVALRRTGWALPLVGAITALFTAMPLGVFALIFVVLAEKELRGGPPAIPADAA